MTQPPDPPAPVPVVPGSTPPLTLAHIMPPPSGPPRTPRWLVAVGAVAASLMLIAGTALVVASLMQPNTPGVVDPTARVAASAPAVTPPKVAWPTPAPAEIKLTVKTREKKCYGSAGCLITYGIELAYEGLPLEPGKVWYVTYEVKGGEEQQVDTLELEGATGEFHYRVSHEETIQTPSSSSTLTAVVTAVSEH